MTYGVELTDKKIVRIFHTSPKKHALWKVRSRASSFVFD